MATRPTPVVLAVLDGWGIAPDHEGNAITRAKTPNMDRFIREYPAMTLYASGNEVGLSFGEMGNSEVGHLNIGAGRVYYQTLPRINKSVSDGSFNDLAAFTDVITHVKKHKSALHLVGLVSPGNVHASQEHCYALLALAKEKKIKHVYVHVILDGRDTTYNSGIDFVRQLEEYMDDVGAGKIATVSGRYYAMDRDNRWDRIEKAYDAMVHGKSGEYFSSAIDAIEASYKKEVHDEEFVPAVIGKKGKPTAMIEDTDGVIFFNFRSDRARQLTKAFVLPSFAKFDRPYIKELFFVTMTEYEKEIPVVVAFPPTVVHNCLAEVISNAGLTQFHVAETEKYAHITFFLNGTVEDPFPLEERSIVPSPQVATYDEAPGMSAKEITKEVLKAIDADKYDVILLNFANVDMVGHTGDLNATMKACSVVDKHLGAIADHVLAKGGVLLITADHGNAEEMVNLHTVQKDKEHSNNPVPFYIIGKEYKGQAGPAGDPPDGDLSLVHPVGVLADVAPTLLEILGVDVPPDMTGRALI
ncbi:MAG: 2,3-bisphosphoglycerate-independent phosphoglycerate mutase [Candidatus Magasanikbacteria bacterium]|jgi:2,3-bisphosphoglycerate-independent phosphoglycerate mutase|nr:2,3-bisphosphoglycerate-independent phosphoglycerate mutase [Candidatus Magasanikbacteria bacterium]MBT4220707.1 2,3-bisphosphoglycerate-independent phosphoglycerate mutase [Candidatus Magasanikbacteria bacterium]MBT4350052.1 2,3-bisphosphoglycerate-independent phosphoglycerate mutase [Candidatus Magasanikbacteria bacterium]MBT4541505.1 2,3-bisphosphoglycerate-independent phosphoglycerate mutase [Candidatus Magasanikbacteria bacterium]MBT6253033.1 2,3-bisphosphoglycerate-independent phosphog